MTFSLENRLISTPLKYGGIGGGVVIVLYLIFYFLGRNPLNDVKLIDIFLLAVFIFFSIREFRDRFNDRTLHFWQGVTGGMITYMTIAILSALFILILTEWIDPNIMTNYIDTRIELLQKNKEALVESIDEASYYEALEGVKKTTPMDITIDDFLKKNL